MNLDGERCVGYVKVVSAALFPVNTLRHTDIYTLISFVWKMLCPDAIAISN